MSEPAGPTLVTERLILRRWRESDREPFARLNADPEVMRHFLRPLERAESDALVDRIEARFEERGYGLWAVERREDSAFLGFTGLAYQSFEAHFTPASRSAGVSTGLHGARATLPRRLVRRCVSGSKTRRSTRSSRSHRRATTPPRGSWSGSGCTAIRLMTSTIRTSRSGIRSDVTFSTALQVRSSPDDRRA